MAVTVHASGSQAATVGTEHFLSSLTSPAPAGTFQLGVDLSPQAAGDTVELRVYKMMKAAGTARVVYLARFVGAQPADDAIKVSIPISNALTDTNALRFSLKQTAGTGRTFDWELLKFA